MDDAYLLFHIVASEGNDVIVTFTLTERSGGMNVGMDYFIFTLIINYVFGL